MFSLPRPVSSQVTTRAPPSLTDAVAEKKCAPDVDARAVCMVRPIRAKTRIRTMVTRRMWILSSPSCDEADVLSPAGPHLPKGVRVLSAYIVRSIEPRAHRGKPHRTFSPGSLLPGRAAIDLARWASATRGRTGP